MGYGPRSRQGSGGADALGARFVALDMTDDANVAAAAERIAEGGLDVLLNNGGIVGPRKAVPEITPHDLREVFKTNVFGIVRMTRAFLPLLERSAIPVIVNVRSGMGLIAVTKDASRFESTLVSLSGTGPENLDGGHDRADHVYAFDLTVRIAAPSRRRSSGAIRVALSAAAAVVRRDVQPLSRAGA